MQQFSGDGAQPAINRAEWLNCGRFTHWRKLNAVRASTAVSAATPLYKVRPRRWMNG